MQFEIALDVVFEEAADVARIIKMGLREIEWVEFSMKSSASLVASGKILSAPFAENGRIYRCPFHPSASACSTHTGSPTFVRWKRYAASLAIPRHGSSRSSAAQKNRLQQLRQNALRFF